MMKNKMRDLDVLDILKYAMVLVIFIYIIVLLVRQGGDAPMADVEKNVMKAISTKGMEEAGTLTNGTIGHFCGICSACCGHWRTGRS